AGAATIAGTVAGVAAGEAIKAQEAKNRGVGPVATNANNKGHYFHNEWNYQEDINTEFNEQTMVCRKCIAAKKCKKTGWSLFRDRFCKTWEDDFSAPNCRDIKF
ncbi:MAG: hypothetical protein MJ156_02880, partial [Alphaproteobacteria bacterium]|nr:hypothetical protein [Alphaproteobacteria bacterium]